MNDERTINEMISEICCQFDICSSGCPLKVGKDDSAKYLCNPLSERNYGLIEEAYNKLYAAQITEDELMNIFTEIEK